MVIGVSVRYPDIPFLYERRGFACMQRNYYKEIYGGPERTEYDADLNVLQGKA